MGNLASVLLVKEPGQRQSRRLVPSIFNLEMRLTSVFDHLQVAGLGDLHHLVNATRAAPDMDGQERVSVVSEDAFWFE